MIRKKTLGDGPGLWPVKDPRGQEGKNPGALLRLAVALCLRPRATTPPENRAVLTYKVNNTSTTVTDNPNKVILPGGITAMAITAMHPIFMTVLK